MRSLFCQKIGGLVASLVLSTCQPVTDIQSVRQVEEGFVKGRVVDTNGRAITGAKIYVTNVSMDECHIEGLTDQAGHFKFKLHEGQWVAYGFMATELNDKPYYLPLWPENSALFTAKGAVRNFIWQPSKEILSADPLKPYYSKTLSIKGCRGAYVFSLGGYAR